MPLPRKERASSSQRLCRMDIQVRVATCVPVRIPSNLSTLALLLVYMYTAVPACRFGQLGINPFVFPLDFHNESIMSYNNCRS